MVQFLVFYCGLTLYEGERSEPNNVLALKKGGPDPPDPLDSPMK
jgi:hypothetical protein